MLRGTLALMTRGLRFDCRRWQMHALRFLLVGFFLLFLFIAWVSSLTALGSAPGLDFFWSITFTNYAFVTLAGMSFFTSTITEEKEEQTLGLLKMAGVNPLGILLGKLGPRLVNALLLLAIQFPFVQLAVTLGGVLHRQVQAVYITLAGYIVLMAGVGLIASVIAHETRRAALLVSLAILIPLAAQVFVYGIFSSVTFPTGVYETIDWFSIWSVVERLRTVMSLGFDGSPIGRQFYTHMAAGAALFAVSWLVFERCTRQPHSPTRSREVSHNVRRRIRFRSLGTAMLITAPVLLAVLLAYSHVRSAVTGIAFQRVPTYEVVVAVCVTLAVGLPIITLIVVAVRPTAEGGDIGECWPNARSIVWKDLNFVSGGAVGMLARFSLYSLITGLIAFVMGVLSGDWDPTAQAAWMFGVGLVGGTLELASHLGRSLRSEVQSQTLSTLTLLPRSIRSLLWAKVAGGLASLIPAGTMTLIGGAFTFVPLMTDIATDGNTDSLVGVLLVLMTVVVVVLEILVFLELTAFFALTIRWGYVVLALICTYFMNTTGWIVGALLSLGGLIGGSSTGGGRIIGILAVVLPWILAIGITLAVVVALYYAIQSRIRRLAGQS